MEKNVHELEIKLEAYNRYLDQSNVDLSKKADLDSDLADYYINIKKFTNDYKDLLIKTEDVNTRIISSSDLSTTNLKVIVELLVSFLISFIIAIIVCLVLGVKKIQEAKFKLEEAKEITEETKKEDE